MKRERKLLKLVEASCSVKGISECSLFVRDALQRWDNKIADAGIEVQVLRLT